MWLNRLSSQGLEKVGKLGGKSVNVSDLSLWLCWGFVFIFCWVSWHPDYFLIDKLMPSGPHPYSNTDSILKNVFQLPKPKYHQLKQVQKILQKFLNQNPINSNIPLITKKIKWSSKSIQKRTYRVCKVWLVKWTKKKRKSFVNWH
jgi:hypothetical protein